MHAVASSSSSSILSALQTHSVRATTADLLQCACPIYYTGGKSRTWRLAAAPIAALPDASTTMTRFERYECLPSALPSAPSEVCFLLLFTHGSSHSTDESH